MQRQDAKEFLAITRGAKKVIVVDLGFLGDTIQLIPALCEIKDNYPGCELHVLTSPVGCEVLKLVGCVDRPRAYPLGPPSPAWYEGLGMIRALRRERFDVLYNFSGADRTVMVSGFVGARHTMGFQGSRKHFWQSWIIRHWISRGAGPLPKPVYEARRHILSLCGFALKPARFDFKIPHAEREWAHNKLPPRVVHLSASASSFLKEWPLANNVKLIRLLLDYDTELSLVLTAGSNRRERERVEGICGEIGSPRVLPIIEELSIARLAALLERCILHIGPDSGVMHLAAALGIPTISIFRRYGDMFHWMPEGPQHAYVDAECSCLGKIRKCDQTGEAACLAGIRAEAVAEIAINRLNSSQLAGDGLRPV